MPNAKPKTKANNEPYRKVKITMWDDPKFRALSALPPSGQSLFIYLLTGPFTGIIPGLFKAGRAALAEELGWNVEAFDLALGEAITLGLVKADLQARVFWLPNAAKHNPPGSINVIKSWAKAFDYLPDCPLKWEAWSSLQAACYGVSEAMGMSYDKAMPLPKDKPSPLPSGIQKAVSSKQIFKDPPLIPPPGKADKNSDVIYSSEFEQAWAIYPKRAGGNNKQAAARNWNARIKSGADPQQIIAGVRRYAEFIEAQGQQNTPYVKQAATFFGRDRHYEEQWDIPLRTGVTSAAGNRFGSISSPDKTIPDGFTGYKP